MTQCIRHARPVKKLETALILLSLGAGGTDAYAFLSLGGIFTANMTGNLILIGLFQRPDYLVTLLGAGLAIAVFVVTVLVGFRVTFRPDATTTHPRVLRLLVAGVVAQTLVLIVWVALAATVPLVVQVALVSASAVAMASQTVVSKRVSSMSGVTTTYVTGTLTSVMQDIAEGKPGNRAIRILSVVALVVGAAATALTMIVTPVLGPVLPWVCVVAALVLIAGALRKNTLVSST